MQSKATTVDAYIAEAEPSRRPALERLRAICLEQLPGYQEQIKYGMAAYVRGEDHTVAFASQKQYLALYGVRQAVIEANAEALAGLDCGKGCIRFRRPDRIDFDLVKRLIGEAAGATRPC